MEKNEIVLFETADNEVSLQVLSVVESYSVAAQCKMMMLMHYALAFIIVVGSR